MIYFLKRNKKQFAIINSNNNYVRQQTNQFQFIFFSVDEFNKMVIIMCTTSVMLN